MDNSILDQNTAASEKSYKIDNRGIHLKEISDVLGVFGSVSFDNILESYVVMPNYEYTNMILCLIRDPDNKNYQNIWNEVAHSIAKVSKMFACCICIANPSGNNSHLLVVGFGEVASSAF